VQRAYELLTRDGVIRSVSGVGPYVADKALENANAFTTSQATCSVRDRPM